MLSMPNLKFGKYLENVDEIYKLFIFIDPFSFEYQMPSMIFD
jgi:hypothetical protein